MNPYDRSESVTVVLSSWRSDNVEQKIICGLMNHFTDAISAPCQFCLESPRTWIISTFHGQLRTQEKTEATRDMSNVKLLKKESIHGDIKVIYLFTTYKQNGLLNIVNFDYCSDLVIDKSHLNSGGLGKDVLLWIYSLFKESELHKEIKEITS